MSQKPSKMAFYKHDLASANGLKTNDVIDALSLVRRIGETAYTIYSMLGITAAVYVPVHYIKYSPWMETFNRSVLVTI